MIIDRRFRSPLASAAVLALASAALSACEQHPYPTPSATAEPAQAPPASQPELMGAPTGPDGRPLPPDAAGAPPPYGEPPPPPPSYPPPGSDNAYPSPPPPAEPAPPRVIAMAPIPNPPDVEPRGRRHRRHHRAHEHDGGPAYAPTQPRPYEYARPSGPAPTPDRVIAGTPVPNPPDGAGHRHHHATAAVAAQPLMRHHRRHPRAPLPVHRGASKPALAKAVPARKAASAQPHKGAATARPHHVAAAKPVAAPAHKAPANGPALKPAVKPTAPLAKPVPALHPAASKPAETAIHKGKSKVVKEGALDAAKLSALSTALAPVLTAHAALHGVDGLRNGAPGDVSLTVPQDFADGLKAEAGKQGMADAAASAVVSAKLSGEGYAVSPTDAQMQPLISGQPNTFKWTVTRMDAARGPLSAEVGAELLGGGKQHVDLGSVRAAPSTRSGVSPQAIGVGILALVVILIGFIMSTGRRPEGTFGRAPPR